MKVIKIVAKQELQQISYLILEKNTKILIDCGSPYAEINKLYKNFSGENNDLIIDAILLTHIHFDHIAGLKSVQEKSPCQVFVENSSKKLINNPIWQCGIPFNQLITFTPNRLIGLNNNEILTIKDIKIKVYHTPGHAPSSMCFEIEKYLFTGDTLFAFTTGRTDLIGGNDKDLNTSLKTITALPQRMCYPGHGINFWLHNV